MKVVFYSCFWGLMVAWLITGCNDAESNADTMLEAANCPVVEGDWRVWRSCSATDGMGTSAGSFSATVSQDGCEITLSQFDDNTDAEWHSTGTLSDAGTIVFEGDVLGGEPCEATMTATELASTCASTERTCDISGEKR